MPWILEILLNSKKREAERAYRKACIKKNKALISELETFDDHNTVRTCITTIKAINKIYTYLWIDRKDINNLQKLVPNMRKWLSVILKLSKTTNVDGFRTSANGSVFKLPSLNDINNGHVKDAFSLAS